VDHLERRLLASRLAADAVAAAVVDHKEFKAMVKLTADAVVLAVVAHQQFKSATSSKIITDAAEVAVVDQQERRPMYKCKPVAVAMVDRQVTRDVSYGGLDSDIDNNLRWSHISLHPISYIPISCIIDDFILALILCPQT